MAEPSTARYLASCRGQPRIGGPSFSTCCHVIIRFAAQLRDSLLPSLLGAVRCLDIGATPTRSAADMPLYSLLRTGRRKEALSCLKTLLRNSRADNPFRRPWIHRAPLGHDDRGPLADGDLPMAPDGREDIVAAACHLLTLANNQKLAFDFDPGNLGWPDTHTVYLAHKAVGWLMPHRPRQPLSSFACYAMPAPRPVKYWATCFSTRFSLITPFQRELTWRRFAQTFPPERRA